MSKPYIICHMMTSLDGRIDCAMVGQLEGVREYYTTLDELELSSTLSGRVTAQTEMALPGVFTAKDNNFLKMRKQMAMRSLSIQRECFYGMMTLVLKSRI